MSAVARNNRLLAGMVRRPRESHPLPPPIVTYQTTLPTPRVDSRFLGGEGVSGKHYYAYAQPNQPNGSMPSRSSNARVPRTESVIVRMVRVSLPQNQYRYEGYNWKNELKQQIVVYGLGESVELKNGRLNLVSS
jgi:hypothetical protein